MGGLERGPDGIPGTWRVYGRDMISHIYKECILSFGVDID